MVGAAHCAIALVRPAGIKGASAELGPEAFAQTDGAHDTGAWLPKRTIHDELQLDNGTHYLRRAGNVLSQVGDQLIRVCAV